jgi:hypothetical protein
MALMTIFGKRVVDISFLIAVVGCILGPYSNNTCYHGPEAVPANPRPFQEKQPDGMALLT